MFGNIRAWFALAAAVLAVAGPAKADDAHYTFTIGTSEVTLPIPNGYCPARGRYDAQAKIASTADHSNLTEISFFLCAEMDADAAPTSWGYLKSPVPIQQGLERKELIAYFKKQIDPADFKKMVDEGQHEASAGLRDTLGKDIDVKLDLKPLDTDDIAVYWGGTVSSDQVGMITCALSITVIKGYVFSFYIFRPFTGPSDIVAALEQVRVNTAQFVAANGG